MRLLSCLALLLATAGIAPAGISSPPGGLQDALAARALLGGGIWARPVRIDNGAPRGSWRGSAYPRTVYALVFELSGILWFYTDADGTQSLSVTHGTVAKDEADPGPLFRAIDPGFTSWAWVDDPPGGWHLAARSVPNGCFVESVAALFRRMDGGGEAESPRLLSYYVGTPRARGHTVLLFSTLGGLVAVDPDSPDEPIRFPAYLGTNPLALSAYLRGGPVAAVRTFPIQFAWKPPAPGRWAALPSQPAPAG